MFQNDLFDTFGDIDIYLFDQLLKGRFNSCRRVLDAGCGYGRNIIYFLRNGFEVFGIDQNEAAVAAVRKTAQLLQPTASPAHFNVALIEDLPFEPSSFDLVICNAVFHFAKDHRHFATMIQSAWRVLRPGGFMFARLASDIGIEALVIPLGHGRFLLPDGTERYLVNEKVLLEYTAKLGANLYEPLKTTNVQNMRCMTTWCLQAPMQKLPMKNPLFS